MEDYERDGRLEQIEAKIDALMNRVASLERAQDDDNEE